MMHFAPFVILILAILGHLVIVRALVNRGYELGLPQRVWQALVVLLVLAAVAGPILMFTFVGVGGAGVLRGGAWSEVPVAWLLYLAACVIALLVGIVVISLRARDARVPAQLSCESDVLDYTDSLGPRTATDGALPRLARLPRNEIFSVEIVRRELRVPRLPASFDGIAILHVSDLHMNGTPERGFFEWAAQRCAEQRADMIAMTGDVMDHLGILDWLPATLGRLDAPLGRYFVLGNHDLHAGGDALRAAIEGLGWTCVAGRVVARDFRGGRLLVGGTESPWAGAHPPMEAAAAPDEFRLLLSHAPHLVHWARRRAIDLVLAGHLHGGQIQLPLLGPIAGGRFHSGVFDLPPTLMHVSRGLGQMAPLPIRFGCRPEITKLVLRAAPR